MNTTQNNHDYQQLFDQVVKRLNNNINGDFIYYKRGYWIGNPIRCSECGHTCKTDYKLYKPSFCDNCGAHMKGRFQI